VGHGGGTYINCYWDTESSTFGSSEGGEGKTTAEMMDSSTFSSWDDGIWSIMCDGHGYPTLELQKLTETSDCPGYNSVIDCWDFNLEFGTLACVGGGDLSSCTDFDLSGCYNDGVFTGEGFTIYNFMTATGNPQGTAATAHVDTGMFRYMGPTGIIKNVSFINANGSGSTTIGILVGISSGTIQDVNISGFIYAVGGNAGGLVGQLSQGGVITNSFFVGNVSSGQGGVGGIAGVNRGTISNSNASGNFTSGGSTVGGLVGSNFGTITDSHATGLVSIDGSTVGGVAGRATGTITRCSFVGDVIEGHGSWYPAGAGGIAGNCYGTITDSYASGTVTSMNTPVGSPHYGGAGGLIGSTTQNCNIDNSHFAGDVTANIRAGGLIGRCSALTSISNCYYLPGTVIPMIGDGLIGQSFGCVLTNNYVGGSCTDSDAGEEYYIYGEISGDSIPPTYITEDTCLGGNMLRETLCDENDDNQDGYIGTASLFDCPNGCLDGECICVDDSECPTNYECDNGECVEIVDFCTDTDGGEEFYLAGSIDNVTGTYDDYCVDGNQVGEYYCSGTTTMYSETTCANACVGGACVCVDDTECPTGYECSSGTCVIIGDSTCNDTDEGINYTYQGEVEATNYPTPIADACCMNCQTETTYGGLWLKEQSCDVGQGTEEDHQCQYGCQDLIFLMHLLLQHNQ